MTNNSKIKSRGGDPAPGEDTPLWKLIYGAFFTFGLPWLYGYDPERVERYGSWVVTIGFLFWLWMIGTMVYGAFGTYNQYVRKLDRIEAEDRATSGCVTVGLWIVGLAAFFGYLAFLNSFERGTGVIVFLLTAILITLLAILYKKR